MRPSDQVFIRTENETKAFDARTFREGFAGKTLEDALQDLLAQNPNLISGRQMDPGSNNPPTFCLLTREMPVFGWALDHLFVDQYGVLTLVETKLLQNPESRREVIGQILEYAANAQEAWPVEKLRATKDSNTGKIADETVREAFGLDDDALEEFWTKVQQNLELGRIRLIVAGDELRPEVRRMLLYLNEKMAHVEVYGLEIRFFGDEKEQVIVPYLIASASTPKSSSVAKNATWTPEALRANYGDLLENEKHLWLRLLDWALSRSLFVESTGKTPAFGIQSSAGNRLGGFSPMATWFYLSEETFAGGRGELKSFCNELKSLNLIRQDIDPETVNSSRNAIRNLGELSETEFERFLEVLEKYGKASEAQAVVGASAAVSSPK